jgi:hypothetical protein
VRLSDHLVQRLRTQPLGEWGAAREALGTGFVEEIHTTSISFVVSNSSANP